jgi:hypothetical protein
MNDPQKHVCGQCLDEWLSENEYLSHICPILGVAPTEADAMGPDALAIQKAALERGLEHIDDEDPIAHSNQLEAIDELELQIAEVAQAEAAQGKQTEEV